MKILIIHNRYQERGGEDEVVDSERKMLEQNGHKVILYSRSNDEIKQYGLLKRVVFFLNDIYCSRQTSRDLLELIRRERPDIAHIHNTFYVITPAAYEVCHSEGLPVVQTLHNYRFLCPIGTFYRKGKVCEQCLKYGKKMAVIHRCWRKSFILSTILVRIVIKFYRRRIFTKTIDHYIALSRFSRQKYLDYGVLEDRISIKPNFVDFDPGESREEKKFVLFLGALQEYKGLDTLLDAWEMMPGAVPLTIIGGGPLKGRIENRIQPMPHIFFPGAMKLREAISYIKQALFVVVPSECYETCPRVIVESFACGIPVLASDMGPIRELVQDGRTGAIFQCGNARDLKLKAERLLADPERRRNMGREARRVYETRLSLKENYEHLISIYQKVIDQKRQSQGKDTDYART